MQYPHIDAEFEVFNKKKSHPFLRASASLQKNISMSIHLGDVSHPVTQALVSSEGFKNFQFIKWTRRVNIPKFWDYLRGDSEASPLYQLMVSAAQRDTLHLPASSQERWDLLNQHGVYRPTTFKGLNAMHAKRNGTSDDQYLYAILGCPDDPAGLHIGHAKVGNNPWLLIYNQV